MKKLMKSIANALLGTAFLLLIAGLATAQHADAPTVPTHAEGDGMGDRTDESAAIHGILEAMQNGDAPALIKLYRSITEPVAHVWAAMALERVHFDLDAATADAKVCEQSLFDSRPGIALLCGQFESGNLRLAGRTQEADAKEAQLIARYQNHGLDQSLAGMKSYQQHEAQIPGLIVEQPTTVTTLMLKQDSPSPVFSAKANGHTFDLMLDTGAGNLLLGQQQARNFGVKPLDESRHVSGWLSKDVPAQRGLLDALQIGGITLRHVPVTVVPRPIALIGANLLAPLGTLRLSRSSLAISGTRQSTGHATCDAPILVATDLWGNTLRIVPQLLINGASHAVMLDTGAGSYLIGSKEALIEVTTLHRDKSAMGDIGGTHAFANVKHAKVNLTIAGQPIQMYFDVYSDSDLRWAITLGAGALRDMDFVFDFQHQKMCFELHPNLH